MTAFSNANIATGQRNLKNTFSKTMTVNFVLKLDERIRQVNIPADTICIRTCVFKHRFGALNN